MLLLFITVVLLFLTRCWLILPKKNEIKKTKRVETCKTCIFLGSGGHTGEMLQLIKSLDSTKFNPRSYVVANTDMLSERTTIKSSKA
jgi:beta-1,4-N-acetylglucosaminyltransferase